MALIAVGHMLHSKGLAATMHCLDTSVSCLVLHMAPTAMIFDSLQEVVSLVGYSSATHYKLGLLPNLVCCFDEAQDRIGGLNMMQGALWVLRHWHIPWEVQEANLTEIHAALLRWACSRLDLP